MIVTYNWLKEFIDISMPPAEVADLLTMLGLEVERMENTGTGMDDVVVAVVLEKTQHPNADKLSLCKVDNGREILNIVCGAQNFNAGDKVALAQLGAILPGDFKIKRSKIRGEESCGMLCSEKELGLANESPGIMVLPQELELGIPVFEALGLKDTIFEIGLTPNRADCLSVIGIAREIAAKLGLILKYANQHVDENGSPIYDSASVEIKDTENCPRYTARFISGCTVAPSPKWLADRLVAVGMRPINNIVDATNYVLMEYGHPLHAFDHDLLAEGKIIVSRAEEGDIFSTLDGQERLLKSTDLTIRDGKKVVALAGIMGGENSEIKDSTSRVLLESAYFNTSAVRITSKRLGIHTESSHRFERGTDPMILTKALDRAASMIAELSGGKIAKGIIDAHPGIIKKQTIRIRLDHINNLLGTNLTSEAVKNMFSRLEFSVTTNDDGVFDVIPPSFRVDIERPIDLIEEVARLNGYDKIPTTMPIARVLSDRPTRHQKIERFVRDLMCEYGFNEVVNFSFISPDSFDKILLGEDDSRRKTVSLLNPLIEEQSVMRTTLLPGLIETCSRNFSFRILNQKIFELRRVYLVQEGKELPDEPICLAGLLSGKRAIEGWNQNKDEVDFYDAKGVIENIFFLLRIDGIIFDNQMVENFYHPGKGCTIHRNGHILGSLGEIHPDIQEKYGFEKPFIYFELNFEELVKSGKEDIKAVAPPRYPESYRDIAMIIDDDIPGIEVLNCIWNLKSREVEDVEIFDLYKGEHIPGGKKSIAARIRYRSSEKTMTDDEVNKIHNKVLETIITKINVVIR